MILVSLSSGLNASTPKSVLIAFILGRVVGSAESRIMKQRVWLVTCAGVGAAILACVLAGCPGIPGIDTPGTNGKSLHERLFTEALDGGFTGTDSCITCHGTVACAVAETAHWLWQGEVANIDGLEGEIHGKRDLLNNFCIAVPSNEGRCTQCHAGFGWKSKSYDFTDGTQVDCLVCHDNTGTYVKHPTANGGGGDPAFKVDGEFVLATTEDLKEVAYSVGPPTRKNCGFCHFNAGGGDNVKHGDLSSALVNPTAEMDVHMGGLDFTCQKCHTEEDHGIAGNALHSVTEGAEAASCTRCHGETNVHQNDPVVGPILNFHTRVACESCHIPAFARQLPTKVEWYWDEAGQDISPIPTDTYGKPLYDKKKGRFVWQKDVVPTLLWFDGKWDRMVIGVSDTFTEAGTAADPVVIAAPTATQDTPGAKLYPFKKMIGRQPADAVNDRLVVPHLFGKGPGENPFWAKFDWDLAIQEGTAYAGQEYSGQYTFVNTVMYLKVSHEIAPAGQARACTDCHGVESFWTQIGLDDPLPG